MFYCYKDSVRLYDDVHCSNNQIQYIKQNIAIILNFKKRFNLATFCKKTVIFGLNFYFFDIFYHFF